jgi:hypothetical protein
VPSPNAAGASVSGLEGVTCLAADDCWAVGDAYESSTGAYPTLIEHWDGAQWSIIPSQTSGEDQLYSVTCISAGDCWAVGFAYLGSTAAVPDDATLTEHWDGIAWTIVPSPYVSEPTGTAPGQGSQDFLESVTCAGAADCWADGYYFMSSTVAQTLMLHWDGTAWTLVQAPDSTFQGAGPETNELYGVTCVTSSDCWASGTYWYGPEPLLNEGLGTCLLVVCVGVGVGHAGQTLTEHWNGTQWTIVQSPDATPPPSVNGAGDDNLLFGMACADSSSCWAVGLYQPVGCSCDQPLILGWDGNAWAITPSPGGFPGGGAYLYSVGCSDPSDCMATGEAADALIEQFGASSSVLVPEFPAPLLAVAAASTAFTAVMRRPR